MSKRRDPLRVLIIGASGVFGSRLAERASLETGIALTLAARNIDKLRALADRLSEAGGGRPDCVALDRDTLTALDLSGYDLVIDAAGPFQASHMRVVESAIAAGANYVDLADGREFVCGFDRFDEVAKGAGVSLVTGASSIPALSHAVIDDLTAGWQTIDHLRVGIYPGNRAPRGLSVVQAILSYVGKPVRVFREGKWQDVPGWGQIHREDIPDIGRRWASVCDTPEQDLLVKRYQPREGAEFFAGLELSLLHLGLAAMALPVRWGWIRSLRPIARPMLAVARWFLPFGSDKGAMSVQARGSDQAGRPVERRWLLKADANHGPYVPVLAALAMIRRFRDRTGPEAGAGACSGILAIEDFASDLQALGIEYAAEAKSGFACATTIGPAAKQKIRGGRIAAV